MRKNLQQPRFESGIFLSYLSKVSLASSSRWGTMTEGLAEETAGMMVHDCLHQAFERAFCRWDDGDPGQAAGDEDYRAQMKRKAWRAKKCLADWDFKVQAAVVSFTSEPLDHLMMLVQQRDAEGGGILFDLTHPHTNMFEAALRQMARMLSEPPWHGPLSTLFNHFLPQDDVASFYDEPDFVAAVAGMPARVRNYLCSMSAQAWWRFVPQFSSWPFLFANIVHPAHSQEVRKEWALQFFATPVCCLDEGFCRKVHAFYAKPSIEESARAMLADSGFLDLLTTWAKKTRISNMNSERLLALIRRSTRRKRPDLERLIAGGALTPWLSRHTGLGGDDPKVLKVQQLLSQGVPLKRKQSQSDCMKPTIGRAHLSYTNNAVKNRQPGEDHREVRKRAARMFATLSGDEQRVWQRKREEDAMLQCGDDLPDRRVYDVQQTMWDLADEKQPLKVNLRPAGSLLATILSESVLLMRGVFNESLVMRLGCSE